MVCSPPPHASLEKRTPELPLVSEGSHHLPSLAEGRGGRLAEDGQVLMGQAPESRSDLLASDELPLAGSPKGTQGIAT
jgi:hypothetical protein